MSDDPPPRQLNTTDLAQLCEQETSRFYRRQEYDPKYCFELFRRAAQEADQFAWDRICTQYQPLVAGWVKQHRGFEGSGEEVEYFVNGAFARVAGSLTREKFGSFPDLGYVLRYLKMCVHSVIVDHTRQIEFGLKQDSIEDSPYEIRSSDPSVEEAVSDQTSRRKLWDMIGERLHDHKERLVVEGLFALELKPRELFDRSRGTFQNVDEIYQIKQNVLARLRRDPELRALSGEDD